MCPVKGAGPARRDTWRIERAEGRFFFTVTDLTICISTRNPPVFMKTPNSKLFEAAYYWGGGTTLE